jgi:type IV pilus assembly protein PilO
MNELIENFMGRPKGQRILICLVVLSAFLAIYWQYFYSARLSELNRAKEQVSRLQTQIASQRRIAGNLAGFQKEVAVLQQQLNLALDQLPDSREIPGLLNSIATLARDNGLDVKRFAPQGDVLREFYAEVPVQVEIVGTFHQLASFFHEIANLSRIVNITQIKIGKPRGFFEERNVMTLDAEAMITTFRYLEEDERPKLVEETSQGRRRR